MGEAKGPRILIARTQVTQSTELKDSLKSAIPEADIVEVNELQEALYRASQLPPDVLLVDLIGNAEEAFILLQALPREKRAFPVVVALSEARGQAADGLLEKGADDVLFKPIEPLVAQTQLLTLIANRFTSPFVFLGSPDGIASLAFDFQGEVISLDEQLIRFQVPFALNRGVMHNIDVAGLKLSILVVSSDPAENERGYVVTAQIDEVKSGTRVDLRRAIIDLIGQRTKEVEGVLFDEDHRKS